MQNEKNVIYLLFLLVIVSVNAQLKPTEFLPNYGKQISQSSSGSLFQSAFDGVNKY
jgi:hypothetical protein